MKSEKPTFISLFSGIGGLDLGLERAGWRCVAQVEKDEWCRRVLAKHWPDVERHDDVRTFDPGHIEHTYGRPDLIAGGFPCQDISSAGRRAGLQGPHSGLWVEMFRVVREVRPRFVLVENVAGLARRGLGQVLGDLASVGFDAVWRCIPAAAVGANHLRARLFLLAHAGGERDGLQAQEIPAGWDEPQYSNWWDTEPGVGRVDDGVPHRVDRLRGLGNAVVPQVAEYLGRLILDG